MKKVDKGFKAIQCSAGTRSKERLSDESSKSRKLTIISLLKHLSMTTCPGEFD